MDELSLGAEVEVTGPPEVEDQNLHPPSKPQEAPNKGDVSIKGVVTMETGRAVEEEPTQKKEEERWRKLFPEIKNCVIVIARKTLDRLKEVKQEEDGEIREECGGRGRRSGDPEPGCDWMEPLELDDSGDEGTFRSFVKKMKVKVLANHVPANSLKRPHGRSRGSGLLRLRQVQSHDVTTDPAQNCSHRHRLQSKSLTESWRQIRRKDKQNKDDIGQSETEHNYSANTPDTLNSQSQDASPSSCRGHKDGDTCSCSTEKKNSPSVVFKKVGGDQWVLRRSKIKEEEEEEEEEGGSIDTEQMKPKKKENPPTYTPSPSPSQSSLRKRRAGCRRCAACLREDCGKCKFCLDKRKFGGPETKKQRCRFRVCLVVETKNKFRPQPLETIEAGEETVTMATTKTKPRKYQWKRRSEEEEEEVKAVKKRRGPWGQRFGRNKAAGRWMKKEEEKRKRKKLTSEAQEVKWRKRRKRRFGQRTARRESEDDSWTHPLMNEEEEEEEEEPKKETYPPQNSGAAGLQLPPSEDSVLHVSTGLTYVLPPPPPSLHPPLLQPKVEEEAVAIWGRREEGWLGEDGGTTEETAGRVEEDERGAYYEVEVEVPGSDSDEETLTASSTPSEVTGDVTVSNVTYEPPKFISLSLGSFSLSGGSLLRLQRALRRAVLPAHWVPVLADGPLLQLLQCSKLSSMADTIVHIQPDLCCFITVQDRRLSDTHTLYLTHTQRITHLSQLVSLLLKLEHLIVCRGSRVRSPACRLEVRSPTCHLLVAPPCFTCLPCLLQGEEEGGDEGGDEVRQDELSLTSDL